MWFKQLQVFQLTHPVTADFDAFLERLQPFEFNRCLPSMPDSLGWVSPYDQEDMPLSRSINGYLSLCMQVEEKILPASVVRQTMLEKVKKIEAAEMRRVRQKEKLSLKDEVMITLLPRAFTKLTKIHAYIDIKNKYVMLGTNSPKRTEQFMSLFKKSVTEHVHPFELKKISPLLTHWLKQQEHLSEFSIEKSCLLQDPDQENRIVRCQQQDLFAASIQDLIKDGCEVKQLALSWQDRVNFILADDFSLSSIRFQEIITTQVKEMEPETHQQQFDADFLIMTDTLALLLADLIALFPNVNRVVDAAPVEAVA